MTHQEKLNLLKNILIPDVFHESRNSFASIINKSINEPDKLIDFSILEKGFYGVREYFNESFSTVCLLDSLTEGYIQKYKKLDNNFLWGVLSSIMNSQNLQFLRPLIDKELFENDRVNYNFENCSLIFKSTDFVVVKIEFMEFEAITILKKSNLNELKDLSTDLDIKVSEMDKIGV